MDKTPLEHTNGDNDLNDIKEQTEHEKLKKLRSTNIIILYGLQESTGEEDKKDVNSLIQTIWYAERSKQTNSYFDEEEI